MYKNNHINMLCTCSIDNFQYVTSKRATSKVSEALSFLISSSPAPRRWTLIIEAAATTT